MVDKQIKQLLHHHDCVVIPDFGGLIARYVSARIHPVKHTLAPPSKKIAFNEKLVLNDGLLISAIAHQQQVSQQEAQRLVAAFVLEAKEKLKTENRFLLPDIGIFRYNAAQKLEFEFVESENLLDASFGLPELIARPLRAEESAVLRALAKQREQQPVNQKLPLRRRLKRAYNITAGLFLGGLTASALYLLSLQTDYNLSSLNPLTLFGAGAGKSTGALYSRYSADFVPLTAEERAAQYQQALPLVAQPAEEAPADWQSFAGNTVAGEEADFTDSVTDEPGVAESIAFAGEVKMPVAEAVKPLEVKAESPAAKPEVAAKKPAAEQAAKAAVATVTSHTGRSYIITGGYSTMENAAYSCDKIRKQGYEPFILLPGYGSRLYRVAAAQFETESEAHAVKKEFRKQFGETIWVLKH